MVVAFGKFNTALLKYSILSAFAFSAPAFAAPAGVAEHPAALGEFKGHYEFSLGKISIGKLGIELEQSASKFSVTSDIQTTGVLKFFVQHSSHTVVSGTGAEFAYPETTYESNYQTRKKKKFVSFVTHHAQAANEKLVPADNPLTRPPVEADLKKDVVDPLSLTLRIRELAWHALHVNQNNFYIKMYDGRRLSELDFVVGDRKNYNYLGKDISVVPLTLKRKLIAGYTKSELDAADPKEPPVTMYFTDDERFMLIRAEATVWFGTASATLTQECGKESCLFTTPSSGQKADATDDGK